MLGHDSGLGYSGFYLAGPGQNGVGPVQIRKGKKRVLGIMLGAKYRTSVQEIPTNEGGRFEDSRLLLIK